MLRKIGYSEPTRGRYLQREAGRKRAIDSPEKCRYYSAHPLENKLTRHVEAPGGRETHPLSAFLFMLLVFPACDRSPWSGGEGRLAQVHPVVSFWQAVTLPVTVH